jgi:ribosomal protein L17
MTLGRNPKQLKHTVRNLVSSLIQYEHIITTPAKAKLTASYVENLITKSKNHALSEREDALKEWKHLLYGKLYNQDITVDKMTTEFIVRYANRSNGYTRMLKLEPRYGDNAPQVVLEMVDNESREMLFWYIAKVVARLELQGLEIDPLTQKNIDKVTSYKTDGVEKFRQTVQICKDQFFENDESLESKPRFKNYSNGFNKQTKNFEVVPRESK